MLTKNRRLPQLVAPVSLRLYAFYDDCACFTGETSYSSPARQAAAYAALRRYRRRLGYIAGFPSMLLHATTSLMRPHSKFGASAPEHAPARGRCDDFDITLYRQLPLLSLTPPGHASDILLRAGDTRLSKPMRALMSRYRPAATAGFLVAGTRGCNTSRTEKMLMHSPRFP